MTPTPVERRSYPRFAHTIEVESQIAGQESTARMLASDLSIGGLYCSSSQDYPEMTRLAVRLMLPDGALSVEGVVVRRTELTSVAGAPRFELGLFFTGLRDEARERLMSFLAAGASK